jgi:hypothetical protein
MTSDNKSLELSPGALAGKKEFSRLNSQSWAVVGGATQLYVMTTQISPVLHLQQSWTGWAGIRHPCLIPLPIQHLTIRHTQFLLDEG